jgi:hypothetical protein
VIALYATIWLSLAGLLLGEFGRRQLRSTRVASQWGPVCSAAGVALGVVHSVVALKNVYGWNHARAVDLTARRAGEVYGVDWTGGLYVNYFFLAWWAAETMWWWRSPNTFLARPAPLVWFWRALVLTMVVNGAVIFGSPAGRIGGVFLTAALLLAWRPQATGRLGGHVSK